jgi:hypothetical protein
MRLNGFCERCRRPRMVTVRRYGTLQMPVGLCQECEDKEAKR